MVLCKVDKCGYWNKGYCESPLVSLNECGMCSFLYKINGGNAIVRKEAFNKIVDEFKNKINILDAEGWINVNEIEVENHECEKEN